MYRCSPNNRLSAPIGTFDPANKATSKSLHIHETPLSNFMLNDLCFLRQDDPDNLTSPHDAFRIPDINPYIPPGTDLDVAATLTAIYRSHCTSLVECVRYMRLKQFHQLFVSFHGTLTVPVQKLLAAPSLAPWIREADWVMYKVCIRHDVCSSSYTKRGLFLIGDDSATITSGSASRSVIRSVCFASTVHQSCFPHHCYFRRLLLPCHPSKTGASYDLRQPSGPSFTC